METTERIVEAYCRHVKHWFTASNIRRANTEVDLVAMDPSGIVFHIEVHVATGPGFSRLTADPYVDYEERQRQLAARARNKIGFYVARKFRSQEVRTLFHNTWRLDLANVRKVIACWDATDDALLLALQNQIEIWKLPDLLAELQRTLGPGYYEDDVLRTIQLVTKALKRG